MAHHEVIIFYQEPTFAEHAGLPLKTYQGTFHVSASDAEEAKTHAIASFRRIQSESSVSWERNIVDITCCKVS